MKRWICIFLILSLFLCLTSCNSYSKKESNIEKDITYEITPIIESDITPIIASNITPIVENEIIPIDDANNQKSDDLTEVSATPTLTEVLVTPTNTVNNIEDETYICFDQLPGFEFGILSNTDANDYYEYLTFEEINHVEDIVSYITTLKEIGFHEIEYSNTYDANSELQFRGMNEEEFEIRIELRDTTCKIVYGKDYGYK